MRKKFVDLLLNLVIGISLVGSLIFSYFYVDEQKEIKKSAEIAEEVQNKIDMLLDEPVEEIQSKDGVVQILPKYQSLYETNNDMIGFIYLDDTHRFPILQRKDDQNYYLNHDFFDNESSLGSIFANTQCQLGESGITLIYGHHIKGNQMFSCLDSYKNAEFSKNFESIQVDTLYEESSYKVVAAALCNMNDDFKYYEYIGDLSKSRFESWRALMGENLIWGSLETLSYKDTIIELSTCSYERKDNRLIVILVKQ